MVEQPGIGYHGQFFFDLMETTLKRIAYGLAAEVAPHGVTALAVTPGFMRTEAILEGFGVTEANWRDAVDQPKAKGFGWADETPCFIGRGIAALAADPNARSKSGGLFGSGRWRTSTGFTDIDGAAALGRYGKEHFPQFFDAKPGYALRMDDHFFIARGFCARHSRPARRARFPDGCPLPHR